MFAVVSELNISILPSIQPIFTVIPQRYYSYEVHVENVSHISLEFSSF